MLISVNGIAHVFLLKSERIPQSIWSMKEVVGREEKWQMGQGELYLDQPNIIV